MKEPDRDESHARFMDDIRQDVRFAWRSLIRRPAFTVVAVLTLAMGIGATTALFSVVEAVLLSPLPYGKPESLAIIWSSWKGFDRTWLSYDEYEAYESEIPGIANAAIFSDGAVNFTEGDRPERARVGFIQHDVFELLGVAPFLGQGFTPEQDRPNGPNVIVLSHELWARRFNSDLSVVGKTIQVNGAASTVVGVMPEGFKLPLDFGGSGPTLAWLPLATDAQRKEVLDEISWPRRANPEVAAGVAFFNSFRDLTASGFFSSKVGVQDLGYMGNRFVPTWTGCPEPVLKKLGLTPGSAD